MITEGAKCAEVHKLESDMEGSKNQLDLTCWAGKDLDRIDLLCVAR